MDKRNMFQEINVNNVKSSNEVKADESPVQAIQKASTEPIDRVQRLSKKK